MKAMIFAAGFGTRLKPFTDHHPKALALVNNKPLLQRNIEYLKSYNITEIVINIHYFGNQIINFLEQNNYFNCNIFISDESEEILETGGGIVKASPLLGQEPFLAMNADILTNLDLHKFIQFYKEKEPLVALAVSERESSRKLMFDKTLKLCGWKDFKTSEEIIGNTQVYKLLAFSGIHIISPHIYPKIKFEGKFSIMKIYMDLMNEEKILGYDHTGDLLIDVGKPDAIKNAEQFFL